ncbi:MAG: VapC toxin family PIN domain ribonuclease [Bacteroidota bacterium]
MRVYLDLCAIQRPLDDQSQLRVRAEADAVLDVLALCASGALTLIASGVHTVEIARCPYPDRRDFVDDVLALASHYVEVDSTLRQLAADYESGGARRLDAIHLAAAVTAEAAYFCTTDDRLLKRGRTLDTRTTSVVSPLEFLLSLE